MKSLYNTCISYICYNLDKICPEDLPHECKEWILDFMVSHDLLTQTNAPRLLCSKLFTNCLKKVTLYLSEQIDDNLLQILGENNKCLQHIAIVHCLKVTDHGILAITSNQSTLTKLELRGLPELTTGGLQNIESVNLMCLDLSDCANICSAGVIDVITRNKNLRCLYLNNCKAVSDMAIYAIATQLGHQLKVVELDFLDNLQDPTGAITFLTENCPNLTSLSLCRYFPVSENHITEFPYIHCRLNGIELKELDLYGNYFSVFPALPENITSLRLSCCGSENIEDLKHKLDSMPHLKSFRLVIACRDSDEESIEMVNAFLDAILPHSGALLTGLQVQAYQLFDHSIRLITHNCTKLTALSLNVPQMHSILLMPLFVPMRGSPERPGLLRSVKLCGMRVLSRLVLALAKHCINLRDVQLSYMECVDYRMLRLLASNCSMLSAVNFNGCRFVSDKGVCAIARNCPLRELRVRATAVTDKCIYVLAQCCPTLEWIAHADYSGKPKFSASALQALKDSCLQRVIC